MTPGVSSKPGHTSPALFEIRGFSETVVAADRIKSPSLSAPRRDAISEAYECFHAFFRLLKNVAGWRPSFAFSEHDDGRAAKSENRFFCTSFEELIERMNLNNPSYRHSTDFDEGEAAEIARFDNVYLALVAEQYIWLIL
jgi:hypothetical protein